MIRAVDMSRDLAGSTGARITCRGDGDTAGGSESAGAAGETAVRAGTAIWPMGHLP